MKRRRAQGFLLVEAMLAAVAIAVGLVGVSAAIGSSLRALTRLQQADRRLRLAEMMLDQAAVEAQCFRADAARAGVFDPPDQDYRWELALAPAHVHIDSKEIPVASVMMTVGGTRLHTLWPAEWVEAP